MRLFHTGRKKLICKSGGEAFAFRETRSMSCSNRRISHVAENAAVYRANRPSVFYDLAKVAVNRLALYLGHSPLGSRILNSLG